MEYSKLKEKANAEGQSFISDECLICVWKKGHELPEGHPDRKYKGRVVFGGNDVWTQNRDVAVFQVIASQPATLEASCAADAHGCFDGHTLEQADAEQAYVQALMKGTDTWIRLPKHQWPQQWHGTYTDPVVPLVLALYGHLDSGVHWEKKAHQELTQRGFVEIEDWKICYWHPNLKVYLVLYVDDFKLVGLVASMKESWQLIR